MTGQVFDEIFSTLPEDSKLPIRNFWVLRYQITEDMDMYIVQWLTSPQLLQSTSVEHLHEFWILKPKI